MYLFVAQLGTLMFHYWVLERQARVYHQKCMYCCAFRPCLEHEEEDNLAPSCETAPLCLGTLFN